MSEDPKLIIRAITLELTQHIRSRYINVRDGQAVGQTTYCSDTARALRGNNIPVLQL